MALALPPAANTAPNGLAVDCRPASYKASAEVPEPSSSPQLMNARSSFSSIREDDTHLAQAFTASKVSRYSKPQTDQPAHDDRFLSDMGTMVQHAEFFPPVTQPTSRLHGNWFPADNFKGWKQINVRGRLASRSFSDLASLSLAWDTRPVPVRRPSKVTGDSPIERLPLELLSSIINLLLLDVPPNGITKRNMDLMSLLLTSKKIHGATLLTLYRQITIPHSKIFQKFLAHVSCHQPLGTLVRRFDFCHFNPSTLFDTASERSQARNLTSDTLLQALDLTPHLQEFLAQEHIDDDLDERVLRKLLFGFERIQALDFCGCSGASFRDAFTSTILSADWSQPAALRLKRLSLHRCNTLAPPVLEALLAHLPGVTHLDLAGTRLTDAALAAIPRSARISHLNLAKCNNLSAGAIAGFVSAHPAAAGGSLVWLSLATDARTHEIFDADAVRSLLPLLPASLKSLSLKGSRMDRSHIPLLRPLTKHLEELALGRGLGVNDTNGLFVPDEPPPPPQQEEEEDNGGGSSPPDEDAASSHSSRQQQALDEWVPHTLRYLDLSDMWHGELDLPTLYNTAGCALLTSTTAPLEVVEVSEDVARRLAKGHAPLTRLGWRVSELGSRTWIVRVAGSGSGSGSGSGGSAGGPAARDTGARWWKMGAENWGMRKIPVARAEVGGMYGSYMFARKL